MKGKYQRKKTSPFISFLRFYTSLLIVFAFIITVFLSSLGFQDIGQNKEATEKEEKQFLRASEDFVDERFSEIYKDLLYFSDILGETDLEDESARNEIAKLWYYFSKRTVVYDQIRFINNDGMEIIRVDYENGTGPRIIVDDELEDQSEQYYFIKAIALGPKTIYISPLDLSVENGEVVRPLKSMIRFAYQIYDENKEKKGIVIFNYKANDTLEVFSDLMSNSKGEINLINNEGYWVTNKDSSKEFGFMFEDKQNVSFAKRYPLEWGEVVRDGAPNSDQFYTYNGLFTYKNVTLKSFVELYINHGIGTYNDPWRLISFIPINGELTYIETDKTTLFLGLLNKYIAIYIFLAVVLIFISLLIMKNGASSKEMAYYTDHDFMTRALNRTAGYKILDTVLEEIKDDSINGAIWFYDVNGVKEVNEALGEESGDNLIIKVGDIIRQTIPSKAELVRYSGDEFIVIFKGITLEQSKLIWQKTVKEFDAFNKKGTTDYKISVSIGFTDLKENKDKAIQSIVDIARKEMEKNKKEIMKKAK